MACKVLATRCAANFFTRGDGFDSEAERGTGVNEGSSKVEPGATGPSVVRAQTLLDPRQVFTG